MGVGGAGLIFDPIAIRIAGGPVGANDFDNEGPGIGGIVVGGEGGGEVGEGAGFEFDGEHGEVFLLKFVVVDGGFHGGDLNGGIIGAGEGEEEVGVMGEEVANDAGISAGDFRRVEDVVLHVNGDEFAEFAFSEEATGALEGGVVNVVVAGKDDEVFFFGEVFDFSELRDGGGDGFFDEDVFVVLEREGRVLGVCFEGGEDEDGVDFRVGDEIGDGIVGFAIEGLRAFFVEFGVDGPKASEFRAGAGVDGVGVEQRDVAGADESDIDCF